MMSDCGAKLALAALEKERARLDTRHQRAKKALDERLNVHAAIAENYQKFIAVVNSEKAPQQKLAEIASFKQEEARLAHIAKKDIKKLMQKQFDLRRDMEALGEEIFYLELRLERK